MHEEILYTAMAKFIRENFHQGLSTREIMAKINIFTIAILIEETGCVKRLMEEIDGGLL